MEKEKTENTKFAIIEISGSQIKVVEGKKYEVDHMEGEKGDKVEIDKVLLLEDGNKTHIGKPYVEKAKVTATIDSQKKGEKIKGLIFKAKARYRKHYGHRSLITRLLIEKISV
jgi:large subunit ribosomal protein L21